MRTQLLKWVVPAFGFVLGLLIAIVGIGPTYFVIGAGALISMTLSAIIS